MQYSLECRTLSNGRYEVCTRHRIRRDAFLRVLRASGDWLTTFIREALSGKGNSSAGVNAAAIAVSDQGKAALLTTSMTQKVLSSLFSKRRTLRKILAMRVIFSQCFQSIIQREYKNPLCNA